MGRPSAIGSEETIQHEGHRLEPESDIKPHSRGPRLVSEEDQRKHRTVSRLHGSRGFVGARDPKFPHAGIQGSALDSQASCGAVRTHDYSACLLQCPANVLTIQILKSDGLSRRVDLCARSQSSQGATKSATGCQYYAALDEVLQLSDISRPRIGGKGVHHFRSNPFDYFLHSCGIMVFFLYSFGRGARSARICGMSRFRIPQSTASPRVWPLSICT
jgi:hypothetical protein